MRAFPGRGAPGTWTAGCRTSSRRRAVTRQHVLLVGSARVRLPLRLLLTAALVALVAGSAAPAARLDGLRVPDDVRSISYFPARGGWTLMWTRFDADAIDRDFARVASLQANTVRVIVPAHTFGYPQPEAEMTARLERVVELAARHGLRVELTLFDWWHDYADVAGSRRWLAALLSPYAGDARIAFVELKNELRPQDEGAGEWAAALIPYVRELTEKPVTVSVPALEPARDLGLLRSALGSSQPDFYSAHFYWRPELAAEHFAAARAAVAPVPLRIGETGYSTAIPYDVLRGVPASPSAREAQQAYYLRSLAVVGRRLGLPPIGPWVLSDFAPDAIPPDDPGLAEPPRVPLRPLSRHGRGEAGGCRPPVDLLRPSLARLQQRLRAGGPRRTRPPGACDLADPSRARRVVRSRRRRRPLRPRLRLDRRIRPRDGAGGGVRDRASRSRGQAGRSLGRDRVRARRCALRRGTCCVALVRERRTAARRRAVGAAPLWHPRMAAATRERDGTSRRRLRRPLPARRPHRRRGVVRRRRLLPSQSQRRDSRNAALIGPTANTSAGRFLGAQDQDKPRRRWGLHPSTDTVHRSGPSRSRHGRACRGQPVGRSSEGRSQGKSVPSETNALLVAGLLHDGLRTGALPLLAPAHPMSAVNQDCSAGREARPDMTSSDRCRPGSRARRRCHRDFLRGTRHPCPRSFVVGLNAIRGAGKWVAGMCPCCDVDRYTVSDEPGCVHWCKAMLELVEIGLDVAERGPLVLSKVDAEHSAGVRHDHSYTFRIALVIDASPLDERATRGRPDVVVSEEPPVVEDVQGSCEDAL